MTENNYNDMVNAVMLSEEETEAIASLVSDSEGFVRFGDVSLYVLGVQTQYAARYLEGLGDSPKLSEGLRYVLSAGGNYHSYRLHMEDVEVFVLRVKSIYMNRRKL